MTDQPSRVTPAEISELLSAARQAVAGRAVRRADRLFERKADLLTRIAAADEHRRSARGRGGGLGTGRRPRRPAPPEGAGRHRSTMIMF